MFPKDSLKHSQQPIDLIESARRCEQRLNQLRKFASDSRTKHNSGKKKNLLDDVVTRINDNVHSLRAWIAALAKGRQTREENIKASVDEVFDNIVLLTNDASRVLAHRLGFSIFVSDESKAAEVARLWVILDEIKDTIGYLHSQVKTVLRGTPDQKERQKRITELAQKRLKSYHVFFRAISQMPEAERRSIRFGVYDLLWGEFPPRLDLNGNVGNADDPGDGKVYDHGSVQQASRILKAFYDAWSQATLQANDANPMSPDILRKMEKISDMAKICLILRGMRQERLLDHFCEKSKDDKHLPLNFETIRSIFEPDDADYAMTFFTEQYRAVCRPWNDGEHIKIPEQEPLPFKFIQEYAKGPYGTVTRNQHAFTDMYYACKTQISDIVKAGFLPEVAILKKLRHRHIVQYIKSYERGIWCGILLKPAATTDLGRLLDRYRRNGLGYDRDSEDRPRDRVVFRPILLTAFGCLSLGLAHIHGSNVSHRNIKPPNILYEKASGSKPTRFLWADFNDAHELSDSGNSKTSSKSRHQYSPRYAAPEIMEEFEARKTRGELEDQESDGDYDSDAPEQSSGVPGNDIGHGRSSDIYSFGIVFLEILSYLIADSGEIPGDFEIRMPFWKNVESLQGWAKEQIRILKPTDALVPLFRLSSKMVARRPGDRPTIFEIVSDLTKENSTKDNMGIGQYFCTACLDQPEEFASHAVIAEAQLVESLENANLVSQNKHKIPVIDRVSLHEVDEELPSAEEPHEPITEDDNDTIYAESSYQPSLSSFGSTRSSLSSKSSLDSIATPWTKVTELKAMFAADKRFSSLCSTAIESQRIGVQRFERNLCRLIKYFATELRKEAAVDDRAGRAAAGVISSLARRLATEIAQTFTSSETITKELDDARLSERDRHRELELSLAAHQLNHVGSANDISSADDAHSVNNLEDEDEDEDEDENEDKNEDDENDKENIPNILQLRAFILSSNAFKNLRWGLYRFLQPDVLQAISREMVPGISSNGQHNVTFHVYWNLLSFCEEELEGSWDLATVLTVTGTGKTAFATTCQEYVVRHWPKTGQAVLTFLESAIHQRTHYSRISPEVDISMDLSAWYSPAKKEYAKIYASGSHHDLIHIAQQLAWISAIFRVPRDGELTYSDVAIEKRGHLQYNLILMDLQNVRNTNKYCWHSLFVNTVIARGFTIPHRESEIGVEVPFEVMMALACILYPLDYHGGTILRGVKLTLVPTAHCSGSVQWHCVSSEQDSYLPRASQVMKQVPEWFKTHDFELLKTARTFLGYCRIAEIHLGTKGIDYNSIQKSDAKSERTRAVISREFAANLGMSAKGIVTASLGSKITIPRRMRVTTKLGLFFQDRVLRARDQPSILYDVEKKTGWLVPELSVILHIAHTWASQQPDISAEILKKLPHAAASGNGGAAAWDAIMKGKGVELRKDSIDGKPQLFGDVINNVLTALENRKDVAVERDNSFFDFHFPTSSGLRGWEFVDLARCSYLAECKEVNVDHKTAGEWGSIAAENPELVVLFCKGLGHPIRPAKHQNICRSWTPIPEGRCYLIASVHCLKSLSENCGGTESCPKLTRHLHWHRPQGTTLFETCNYGVGSRCNPLQELIAKKKAFAPGILEPHGAVIFGKMKQAMTTCCEPFKASNEVPLNENTSLNGSSHQAENSAPTVPAAEFDIIPSPQIRRNNDDSSYTSRQRRISVDGTAQDSDPIAILPLVNGTRTLRVRPGYDDLKRIRHFDTLDQQRESTK